MLDGSTNIAGVTVLTSDEMHATQRPKMQVFASKSSPRRSFRSTSLHILATLLLIP